MPSLRSYLLPAGSFGIIFAIVILILFPLPAGTEVLTVVLAVTSGLLRAAAVVILQSILRTEEVSRVIPVVFSYPIYVAIMAVPLLGETLSYLHWIAIFTVVAGVVMASVKKGSTGSFKLLSKPFLLLFGVGVFMATGDIAAKYVLRNIDFWNMLSINTLCVGGTFVLLSIRRSTFEQLRKMEGRNKALGLVVLNGILVQVGFLLNFVAIQNGPVSLVAAIIGSRPFFVLIYSFILSRILPHFLIWETGKAALVLRVAAALLVVGGIAIIYLY